MADFTDIDAEDDPFAYRYDTQLLIDGPIVGCYMSGVGNPNGNYANIDYAAIVTPLSSAVTSATVATVVFVVEWDAVEYAK